MANNIHCIYIYIWASLVAQTVKKLPAEKETQVWSMGQEDPLEKGMATHSNTLAWKIPWTEQRGRLQGHGISRSHSRPSNFTSQESECLPLLAGRSSDSMFRLIRVNTGMAIHVPRTLSTDIFVQNRCTVCMLRLSLHSCKLGGKNVIFKLEIQAVRKITIFFLWKQDCCSAPCHFSVGSHHPGTFTEFSWEQVRKSAPTEHSPLNSLISQWCSLSLGSLT